jgi:superfamily I DNA/RNA helicase
VADGGRNIDEERRLGDVGVTRAQEYLTVTMSKTRMKWGKPRPSLVSRFVMEMRGETERARRIAEQAKQLFSQPEPNPKALAKKTRRKKTSRRPLARG